MDRQISAGGFSMRSVSIGDPMGWCHPVKVEEIFGRVKRKWPEINTFSAHLHNSRGMAITAAYAAIKTLDGDDTLRLQGTIGGIGGCPYCGNGRSTGMAPTEDFMHMLEGMGIETGVDLGKLIDCVWMLEKMIGRRAWGHVSRCGPRPMTIERVVRRQRAVRRDGGAGRALQQGPQLYEGCIYPWDKPITSPYLDRALRGLPTYEPDGAWPWEEEFFPKPSRSPAK